MNKRDFFDKQVEWVIERLPTKIAAVLHTVPLCVEDRPSKRRAKELELQSDDELCGLFVGTTLTHCYSETMPMPNMIFLFRKGIISLAQENSGESIYSENGLAELRIQIETTILHEIAHYHGMNERDVDVLGYA